MAERICTSTADCRQYCLALDNTGGFAFAGESEVACEWPQKLAEIEAQDLASKPNGALLSMLGAKLGEVLDAHAEQEEDPTMVKIEEGFGLLQGVFNKQLDAWKYSAKAVAEGRIPTDIEVRYHAGELKKAQLTAGEKSAKLEPNTLTFAQAKHDHTTLEEHGLVFDEGTADTITRLVDNVTHGRPTLLVGDKGIAKTKMAEFTAGLFSGDHEVTVISGHGSMMSDELVGKVDLVPRKGTVFHEGKVIQCMREGRPLVLDEVNLADQQIMMRLQDILLKKPGDAVILQENGNEPVVIKRGFCVIATANEASARYNAREQLDPAFRDRFDVVQVQYPDVDVDHITQYPSVNMRLALAHTITESGKVNSHVPVNDAILLARLAHATQRLYSKPAKDVAGSLMGSTTDLLDASEPLLTDCITPRKMVTIMQRVATGTLPGVTVSSETARTIEALDQYGTHNQTYAKKLLDDYLKPKSR